MFFDDIAGLGTELPGLLDDLQWSPAEVAAWNAGANATVLAARQLMHEHKALNWQELSPMAAPEPATCALGGNSSVGGVGDAEPFRGLAKLCGDGKNANDVQTLPWFLHVYPSRGVQPNQTNCLPDCPRLPNMEQIIAAFLLARGDFAWMGYEYNGCADAIDSPYKNHGGMHYWAPSRWADVMAEDFGTPLGRCSESKTQPGVYERKFSSGKTVSLDCGTWQASFGSTAARQH